jgi:hypothetical protein
MSLSRPTQPFSFFSQYCVPRSDGSGERLRDPQAQKNQRQLPRIDCALDPLRVAKYELGPASFFTMETATSFMGFEGDISGLNYSLFLPDINACDRFWCAAVLAARPTRWQARGMKTLRAGVMLASVVLFHGITTLPMVAASKPTAPAATKVEEKTPVIPGIEIERPNGAFLGLQIVDNHFVLSFYDVKKKPASADVNRATLRWPVKYQPNDERTVLNRSADGTALSSGMTVRPPRKFKVFMSLFVDGNESAVESYTIDFHD